MALFPIGALPPPPNPRETSLSTELLDRLKAMPATLFEELLFRLKPPPGLIPPAPADQTTRALKLLEWAEWEGGIGLSAVEEELGRVGRGEKLKAGETTPPWWKRWGWVLAAGFLTLVIGAYLARGEVAPSAVAPNSGEGDTQPQRPGRHVQVLTTPIPLTLVWVEGGTEAGGAPDPASGTSALRRYLGGHLIPALVRAGVRAITLDISLHPDGGSGDLEPYRSALQQAHDAGILIAAPWPSGAHAPLIDECPTPGQGACFDRLLSTWVGEGPISHLPTCPTDRVSPAMMLSWLLPNRVNGGARLKPVDLMGLTCQSSQIEVLGPLPRPRPWEEVSSRLILDQEPGALGQVHDRVILIGQHSQDDIHRVVTPTGVEEIQGVELHALATQHLYLAQFSPASPERP